MTKLKRERKICVVASYIVSLEELIMHVLHYEDELSLIIEYLNHKPFMVEEKVKKVIKRILRLHYSNVRLKELKFDYKDSDNITHGLTYFKVKLRGTINDFKKLEKANHFSLPFDWNIRAL